VKKAPSLTLTQQLQIVISNTMAGRLSSRVWYCVNGQERALLWRWKQNLNCTHRKPETFCWRSHQQALIVFWHRHTVTHVRDMSNFFHWRIVITPRTDIRVFSRSVRGDDDYAIHVKRDVFKEEDPVLLSSLF